MKSCSIFWLLLAVSTVSSLDLTGIEDVAYYNYVGEVITFFVGESVEVTSRDQEIVSVDGSGIPSSYTALVFNNLVIQFIPRGIDKFFPSLILLHVTNCQLKEINQFDLTDLPHLISLDLEGNELKYLPGDLFIDNTELQEVNFRNNKLSEIGEDLFSSLDGLQSINFEDNECISTSAANMQSEILNLIKLECPSPRDLRKKHCSNETEDLKKENSALKKEIETLKSELSSLDLKFESCDGNLNSATKNILMQTKKLQTPSKKKDLKLPRNINLVCKVHETRFEAVDLKIDAQGTEIQGIVDKTGKALDGKDCETLEVRHQQTLHLPTNLGEKLRNLKHFEVTFSGLFEIGKALANMEKLESLNFTGNKLREVLAESFVGLIDLKLLDLSYNNIEVLDSNVFKAVAHLKFLNLEHNLLSTLGDGIFDSLKDLQTLNLSNNKLKIICAYLLAQHAELTVVDLSNNVCIDKKYSPASVKEIEADIIDHCIAPIEINCNEDVDDKTSCISVELRIDYPKTKISDVNFINQDDQQILSFSVVNQSMLFMPFELAKKMPNLTEISIERSKLSVLQKFDFEGLNKLTKIAIIFNNITSIQSGTFDEVRKLGNLILSSNHIHALPQKAFSPLAELKTLDISGNLIKRLPANILKPKNVIKDFNASGNQLEFVETKILRYLKAAKLIDLTGNACINLKYEKSSNRSSRALVELSGEIDLYCSEDSTEV